MIPLENRKILPYKLFSKMRQSDMYPEKGVEGPYERNLDSSSLHVRRL